MKGVYNSTEASIYGDFEKNPEIYGLFGIDSISSVSFKLSNNNNQNIKLIKSLSDYDLSPSSPEYIMVNKVATIYRIVSAIMLGISAALVIISVIVMVNYYSNNINKDKRKIGIYNSLGLPFSEIGKTYYIQGLFVSIVSIILSTLFSMGILGFINSILKTSKFYDIAFPGINYLFVGLGLVICLVLSALSIFFIIKKYDKKNNPLVVIRNR